MENYAITPYITKDEYQRIYNNFLNNKGYMTKLVNKAMNDVAGYLIRAEIPTKSNEEKVVAITFIPNIKFNAKPRFIKAVGINQVLVGGKRKLKKLLKKYGEIDKIESESIISSFISPEDLNSIQISYFKDSNFSYNDFYNYIIAFENKIKKYYNNDNVKIIVI